MSSYASAMLKAGLNHADWIEEEQCRRIFGDFWGIENEPYYDLDELIYRLWLLMIEVVDCSFLPIPASYFVQKFPALDIQVSFTMHPTRLS